jgi:5-methylcytosine-specific restriction endonuclease McrA
VIRVNRGAEPKQLQPLRIAKLAALGALGRTPTSDDISGYRDVAKELWTVQHYKCCYCEQKLPLSYNDVEHFRPKGRAIRKPGCTLTHGYWWLAFSWDNLLYACPSCNRSAKNDQFPLLNGSVSLTETAPPPGAELPLLLDPGSQVNPVEHIQYIEQPIRGGSPETHWWARPRNASIYGNSTIEVCKLNNSAHRELRNDYLRTTITPQIEALRDAIDSSSRQLIRREFARAMGLLAPRNSYVGFAYDALLAKMPNLVVTKALPAGWPAPGQVC